MNVCYIYLCYLQIDMDPGTLSHVQVCAKFQPRPWAKSNAASYRRSISLSSNHESIRSANLLQAFWPPTKLLNYT